MRKAHVRSFQAKGRPITNEEVSAAEDVFGYNTDMMCSMRFTSTLRIMTTYLPPGRDSMPMEI